MAGHPPDISDEQAATIRRRRAEGASLRAIAAELGIHHSTVAQHAKDTGQLEPDELYAELVLQLRDACEKNLLEALEATEKTDYRQMRDVMQRRNVLTQQAKGLLVSKGLYMAPSTSVSEESREAEGFLSTLAEDGVKRKRPRKRKTGESAPA